MQLKGRQEILSASQTFSCYTAMDPLKLLTAINSVLWTTVLFVTVA